GHGLEGAGTARAGAPGQAAAVDRDAVADRQFAGERRPEDQQATVGVGLDALDGPQDFDQAGKHDFKIARCPPPYQPAAFGRGDSRQGGTTPPQCPNSQSPSFTKPFALGETETLGSC